MARYGPSAYLFEFDLFRTLIAVRVPTDVKKTKKSKIGRSAFFRWPPAVTWLPLRGATPSERQNDLGIKIYYTN